MTIVEQAENELRLLMLCKPSTARALIDDVKRLRAELAGKRTSQEVSTQMECPDCHAVTRWGRHLDLDCHTIATLRAELDAANALVKRHEAALEWAFDKSMGGLPIILRKIERKAEGIQFGIDKYTIYGLKNVSDWNDTPLDAIEAATKEESNGNG